MLDTLRIDFYKARALAAAAVLMTASVASAEVIGGVQFPEGVQRVRTTRARYLSGLSSRAVRQLDELLAATNS